MGSHILTQKSKITELFYCACLRANKFRFNYGRQANRTIKDLLIPHPNNIPIWVKQANLSMYDGINAPFTKKAAEYILDTDQWAWFSYDELFTIERGKGPRIKDLNDEGTPLLSLLLSILRMVSLVILLISHVIQEIQSVLIETVLLLKPIISQNPIVPQKTFISLHQNLN